MPEGSGLIGYAIHAGSRTSNLPTLRGLLWRVVRPQAPGQPLVRQGGCWYASAADHSLKPPGHSWPISSGSVVRPPKPTRNHILTSGGPGAKTGFGSIWCFWGGSTWSAERGKPPRSNGRPRSSERSRMDDNRVYPVETLSEDPKRNNVFPLNEPACYVLMDVDGPFGCGSKRSTKIYCDSQA